MSAAQHNASIRVCFVSLHAYPLFNPQVNAVFGGAEVDLYLLAAELAKDSRFDVRFVVGDYGQAEMERREGVTLIKSLDVKAGYFLHVGKIWKALGQADADLYVQEASSLLTVTVALFCKRHHRRFIYRTAHTNETDGTYFRRHPLRGRLFEWAMGTSDPLITQNEEDRTRLQGRGFDSIVIRNACRLHDIDFGGRDYIFWAGRSDGFKQPELFIQMARAFPQLSFCMACSRASGDSRYKAMAQRAAAIPNMKFIAGVPFEQIDSYFEKALVYVSTSQSEGFPNTFVQACKSGTPVLSFNVNPDGFLDRYQCGLCANGDWNRFLKLLKEILSADNREKFGRNGRLYAEQNHDIRNIMEAYAKLLDRRG